MLLGGGLVGCAAEPAPAPEPSATEAPEVEPIFASDEEALAAALAVYDGYLAVDREIGAASGAQPERVREFVTDDYATSAITQYSALSNTGGRIEGPVVYDSAKLIQWGAAESGATDVQVYVCSDVSRAHLFNAAGGDDMTPADRQERLPLSLIFRASDGSKLLLDESALWSGSSTC